MRRIVCLLIVCRPIGCPDSMLGTWTAEGPPQPTDERPFRVALSTVVPWLPPTCGGSGQPRGCLRRPSPTAPAFTGPTLARSNGLSAMCPSTTSAGLRGPFGSMFGSCSRQFVRDPLGGPRVGRRSNPAHPASGNGHGAPEGGHPAGRGVGRLTGAGFDLGHAFGQDVGDDLADRGPVCLALHPVERYEIFRGDQ